MIVAPTIGQRVLDLPAPRNATTLAGVQERGRDAGDRGIFGSRTSSSPARTAIST
ncbi:MAG: hypothetical protein ABR569_06045 [Gaiellaceae bacterium]